MTVHIGVDSLDAIIEGGISAEDISAITGSSREYAEGILDALIAAGIGERVNGIVEFSSGDRLRAALLLVGRGAQLERVSERLGWRDFEGLAAAILERNGFGVIKNMMLRNPRMEIDIVGIKHGVAVLIDCKHWSRCGRRAMERAAARQVERTRRYVAQTPGALAVPAMVSMYMGETDFVGRVPVVPIDRLESFLDELYGNLEDISVIGAS